MTLWMNYRRWQQRLLTTKPYGHTLNRRQVFSPDGRLVFYDTRNQDSDIGITTRIESVDLISNMVDVIYESRKPSVYGPGVGAVACHPRSHRLVFIHGLHECNEQMPYGPTRRFGALVDLDSRRSEVLSAESRILDPPMWGVLRGGTHAHSWSSQGDYLSFTYNDEWVAQRASRTGISDARTVGVMYTQTPPPEWDSNVPHLHGQFWSGVIVPIVDCAAPGSDEVEFACEECFVGTSGYRRFDGIWQQLAVAFQGRTRDANGEVVEEVFLADLPTTVPIDIDMHPMDPWGRLAAIPGTRIRRMTYTGSRSIPGIQGPRNWLTSSPDGCWIYFLMADDQKRIQLFSVSTSTSEIKQISNLPSSIQDQVSLSADGQVASFVVDGEIQLLQLESGIAHSLEIVDELSQSKLDYSPPVGAIHFSPFRPLLVYNRYVIQNGHPYLQVFCAEPC